MTAEELKQALDYDPKTGVFRWKQSRRGTGKGDKAGSKMSHGYITIRINGGQYTAHRLAWFYVHGAWPPQEIDHINGIRNDNRIANLRLATPAQNRMNNRLRKDNKARLKGVSFDKRKRLWRAIIQIDGKQSFLGYWNTPEEAKAAYDEAARKYFGQFWRAA